jgi:hypothetical protein
MLNRRAIEEAVTDDSTLAPGKPWRDTLYVSHADIYFFRVIDTISSIFGVYSDIV